MLSDLIIGGERFLLADILTNVAVAFVLGTAAAIVYRRTHRTVDYSASFVNTLVFVPMITAIVMMVIGDNLARAFGLVGAMSIIRFRTAIKDTRDTSFVFLVLAAGMAAGTGYHLIALAGTATILAIAIAFSLGGLRSAQADELLLRISILPDERGAMLHEQVFHRFLRKHKLLNVRGRNEGRILELSYLVRLKAPDECRGFAQALGAIEGIEEVSLAATEETAEA